MSQVVKVKSGGYHLKYSNPGSLEADREAEKDVREYLNSRQWNFLLEAVKSGAKFQRNRFLTMIAGVSGYPVGAILRLHHPRFLSRFSERRA